MVTRQQVSRDIALMELTPGLKQTSRRYDPRYYNLQGDLGLTHQELHGIVVGLENKYRLTIPSEKIESISTVDNLIEYVVRVANQRI